MSNYLYINAQGKPVRSHSFSAGSDLRTCKKLYEFRRVKGIRERGAKASSRFGDAIEAAIQHFHQSGQEKGTGVAKFRELWNVHNAEDMNFTSREGSWEDLDVMGRQMMALYEIRAESLPFRNARFQMNFWKEPLPDLPGIGFTAYTDMLCEPEWDHPLLPKIDPPADLKRQLIVDIKTGKAGIDEDLVSLDPQLRSYAWVSGISDVGFLFLLKASVKLERGDEVTILRDSDKVRASGRLFAGDKAVVLDATDLITVLKPEIYEKFADEAKGKRGKNLEAIKTSYYEEHGFVFNPIDCTKVKIQFAAARISQEDMAEAGENIADEIREIRKAWEHQWFPKQPSVRFPSTKCGMCAFRGLCLKNQKLAEELLVLPSGYVDTPAPPETTDWLEELIAE